MKTLTIFFTLLALTLLPAHPTTAQEQTYPLWSQNFARGFRDIKWHSSPKDAKNMKTAIEKSDLLICERQNEDLTMGQAKIESIQYTYSTTHGLEEVYMTAQGQDNYKKLSSLLTENLGSPQSSTPENMTWTPKDLQIHLSQDPSQGFVSCLIAYTGKGLPKTTPKPLPSDGWNDIKWGTFPDELRGLSLDYKESGYTVYSRPKDQPNLGTAPISRTVYTFDHKYGLIQAALGTETKAKYLQLYLALEDLYGLPIKADAKQAIWQDANTTITLEYIQSGKIAACRIKNRAIENQKEKDSHSDPSEQTPGAFRGIQWTSKPSDNKNLTKLKEEGPDTAYTKQNEKLIYGEADLTQIQYHFNDQFGLYQTLLTAKGEDNHKKIQRSLNDQYASLNASDETPSWTTNTYSIKLQYDPQTQISTITYSHIPTEQKITAATAKPATETQTKTPPVHETSSDVVPVTLPDVPSETSADMTPEMPASPDIAPQTSSDVLPDVPTPTSQDVSSDIPTNISSDISTDIDANTSSDISIDVPIEVTQETSADISIDIPVVVSIDIALSSDISLDITELLEDVPIDLTHDITQSFRGVYWGSSPTETPNLQPLSDDHGLQTYSIQSDQLSYGPVPLEKILYLYSKDLGFVCAKLYLKDKFHFNQMEQELIQTYGSPSTILPNFSSWEKDPIAVTLAYVQEEDATVCTITHLPLHQEAVAIATQEVARFPNSPDSFGGITWGTLPTQIPDMQPLSPGSDLYTRKTDQLTYNSIPVISIQYVFPKDHGFGGALITVDPSHAQTLIKTLKAEHETPFEETSDLLVWLDNTSTVQLTRNHLRNQYRLLIGNTKIMRNAR